MATTRQTLAPVGYSSAHISTNATTLIKTGLGVLRALIINAKGASLNTCTIYDGIDASGAVIAVPDVLTAGTVTLVYDVQFLTGLCVVTATGTAADLTFTFV